MRECEKYLFDFVIRINNYRKEKEKNENSVF